MSQGTTNTITDNPINQQIALKTIKKLGFSVSAVWNGQEALDYLMQPDSSSQPRPDVILMDVQMPIMDGYKATHTIRHASPFKGDERIQSTPIVAMTASAIQGDREKCENAGMNDYLAKPVKGKTLEKMLVKWTLERRKKTVVVKASEPETRNTRAQQRQGTRGTAPTKSNAPRIALPSSLDLPAPSPDKLASKLNELDYVSNAAIARSSETPDTRAMRHLQHEEKAMRLRDEQLIGSGDGPEKQFYRRGSDDVDGTTSDSGARKLTRENIEKLTHDKEENLTRTPSEDESSLAVHASVRARSSATGLGEGTKGENQRIPVLPRRKHGPF